MRSAPAIAARCPALVPVRLRSLSVQIQLAAAALAALVAACGGAVAAPVERQLVAAPGPLAERTLLTGELVAEQATSVVVPDLGIRPLEIRWLVENGAAVKAGDVLVELDNGALAEHLEERRLAVQQSSSAIEAVRSEVGGKVADAEFEVERRRAELEKARVDAAVPAGLRSDEEYRRLQSELAKAERRLADAERVLADERSTSQAQVEKMQLALRRRQAELRRVEAGIAELSLKAPQDGIVLIAENSDQERPWAVGDAVYPGHELASLPDAGALIVRARLFDVDDGSLAPGQPVTVELDAHPELSFRGRVRGIDRIALQQGRSSNARIFWVDVELDQPDLARMRPGMTVKVSVERTVGSGSADEVTVPRESLDASDPGSARVRLADGSWRAVELGECTALRCTVRSGVEVGARLGRADAGATAEVR